MPLEPIDSPSLHRQRFPSRRSAVLGLRAMVATSQPIAAQAGLRIMQEGGNAFDAAVATAAMLNVVEPTSTGIGGDCFALNYHASSGEITALNGSGRSPAALDLDELRRRGLDRMPRRGALTVTVPGTVDGWASLLERHGRMQLRDVLGPAIDTAEQGFPVSELIASAWRLSEPVLEGHAAARRHYLPLGRAPRAGEVVELPALARSLRLIAEGGRDAFYEGPIASAIAESVQREGGVLSTYDLAKHVSTWDRPISTDYRGLTVWECPPNGQGLVALVALAVLDGLTVKEGQPVADWGTADHLHPLIEATRLGFAEAHAWVGDPRFADLPVEQILSPQYVAHLRSLLSGESALADPVSTVAPGSDTVYLTTIDSAGNACSFINSNYMGFGSGIVAGDTGIALQNRGAAFSMEDDHPNRLGPSKRPYHTIIPAIATRANGSLYSSFGVMGGHMQPQGHLQVLTNLIDFGMDPQQALDAPRWQLTTDGRLALEPWFGESVRTELALRRHVLVPRHETPPAGTFGGGQIIAVTNSGVRIGGSDPRKDGCVVAE